MNIEPAYADHGTVTHVADPTPMHDGRRRSKCGVPFVHAHPFKRATSGPWCRKCQDRLILDAWKAMYRAWEEGRDASPSALDLVDAAGEVLGVTFGYEDADALWDASNDGTSMIDQLKLLRARQGL